MKYLSVIISTYDIRTAVMLITMITLKIKGGVGAVIVASPKELYVLSGQEGVLRCQNRTTNPYTYVSNARWSRRYVNGSDISIGTSDSVYVYKHTLTFLPISRENEGNYFCCTASLCSNIAQVRISVPPSIVAAKSHYTSTIGSQITLKCNITGQGVPPAEFRWRIDGREIIVDNVTVFISQSTLTMIITNLTMSDAGTYICEGANEQSYHNDRIELRMEPHPYENLTENPSNNTAENKTLLLKVLAINIQVSCQVFKQSLQAILQHFIWENYGYTVMVMAKQIECRTTEGKGIYDIMISGFLTNDSLQSFVVDLNNTEQGIDLVIGKLKLCYKNCLEPSPTSSDSDSNSEDSNVNDNINIWIITFIILIIFFLLVLAIFCFVIFYKRYFWTSNKTAEYQVTQQTTIAGPTLNADDTTTNITREASTISDSTPPEPQYSTLQFEYNNQCNSTFLNYSKLSTSYSGPKNGYLHLQHHTLLQKKNTSPSHGVNTNTNVDHNYNVIPSPTYKSYVDVIY